MSPEDKKKFAEIMYGIADNFGGQISKEGLFMRFEALRNYSIADVSQSATWLLINRERTFPAVPTVKEFVDAIKALAGPVISPKSRAHIQLDIVLRKLKIEGRNARIDFEDAITFKLMTERWPYSSWATAVTLNDLEFFPKKFIDAYLAYAERDIAEAIALPVASENVVRLKKLAGGIGRKIA